MNTNNTFHACPFCGNCEDEDFDVDYIQPNVAMPKTWFVTCNWCGANGPYSSSKQNAIAEWNTRKTPEKKA